mgnify:FL=1|jgi:plasmid stabilization system protein ParE
MSIYYKRTAIEDIQRAASYIRSTFQNEKVARLVTAFLVGAITGLADAPCTGHPVSADLSGCTPCRVLTVPCFLIFYRLRSTGDIEILRVLENSPDYTPALF